MASRIRRWTGLASDYTLAQLLVQALGAAAGLVFVNVMPVREYALYALALSVLSFAAMASDLGISNALLYFRRETRVTRGDFAVYVAAALALRRILTGVGFAAASVFIWYAAAGQHFAAAEVLAVLGATLLVLWLQVHASLALLCLRLAEAYRGSYVAEVGGNALRLAGAIAMPLCGVVSAFAGTLVGAAGAMLTLRLGTQALKRLPGAGASAPVDRAHCRRLIRYVLPGAASALYFAFQAPLMVWLSSYFGAAHNIAEVGALGRLALLFGLVSGFVGTVVLPTLAGVTDEGRYRRRYLACWAILLPLGVVMFSLFAAIPQYLLWLLGADYAGLERELVLVVLTSVIAMWGAFGVAINNARGWVRRQWLALLAYIALQCGLAASLDLSTTYGVILFGLYSALAGTGIALAFNLLGFWRPRYVSLERA